MSITITISAGEVLDISELVTGGFAMVLTPIVRFTVTTAPEPA